MNEYYLTTENLKEHCNILRAGDKVYLSGTVYTARDAAHKRIFEYMTDGKELPFKIKNSIIYYAGPTPTPDNLPIGSCGPTTSRRMDSFSPRLYDMGLTATIGKGERNEQVCKAIKDNWEKHFKPLIEVAVEKVNKPRTLTPGDCDLMMCGILEPDEANAWANYNNMINDMRYKEECRYVV